MRKTAKNSFFQWIRDPAALATLTMIVIWLLSMFVFPGFRTLKHNITLLQTGSFLGLIAAGQAMVVLTGGMDMSVSSIVTLSSFALSSAIQHGMSSFTGIVLALGMSMFIGFLNATGINFLRISPIIMTIAMMSIIEGALLVFTQGTPPSGCGDIIEFLSSGTPLGIPNSILFWMLILLLFVWITGKTKYGRHIYAVGANEKAAVLSGVNVKMVKYIVYIASGLCSGLAGIMLLGNLGSTTITLGTPYQMYSVSSVVVGGIAITGGKGKYWGVVAGTIIVILLRDILNVTRISAAGKELFQGLLILLVLFAYGREKKNA